MTCALVALGLGDIFAAKRCLSLLDPMLTTLCCDFKITDFISCVSTLLEYGFLGVNPCGNHERT